MAHTINVFARKSVCRPVRAVPTECVRWAPQREYLDLEVGRRVGESRDGVLAYLNTGTARVLSHTSCAVMRCAALRRAARTSGCVRRQAGYDGHAGWPAGLGLAHGIPSLGRENFGRCFCPANPYWQLMLVR